MYLVDTNVISEARKGRKANPGVIDFLRANQANDLYLCVQTVGEIRRGVEIIRHRGDRPQADRLAAWLTHVLEEYGDHLLDFDIDCAQVWGRLMAPSAQHPIDKQIAAIALIYDLAVVTRHTQDYAGTGVKLLNPFI
ncbi:type II toxin-antitoxin system VapC family toxin [Rugamonas apoptosis]|uniref:Type II toxin-antitoxin system VapC family toxin n=1 Tax=Rugamonas apoptosis TaxID=2758570 RepID=A0A7W2FC24_9BURK|nr:type II toxin-antitoxin system VapC family toxin [Rugamonas apoptosis]MBA5688960.1 type II toxin-antitoxin system VapC family toxin [Rugamonas apoptosis]